MTNNLIPSKSEFDDAIEKFGDDDVIYKITSERLKCYWGHPADMAETLSILLLIWHQAYYRYGEFD